jgi:hypothetical protein
MYTLIVNLTPAQLSIFQEASESIIIAKPSMGGNEPNVAWVSFHPLPTNTVTWEEQYGIYVSTVGLQNGAVLTQLSSASFPASPDGLYTLQTDGVITGPSPSGEPDTYSLLNEYAAQPVMTVGLYQNATANGTAILNSAVSAAVTPEGQTAKMVPYTNVYIWAQATIASNTVVTTVSSPQTELTFGGGVDTITVEYNSQTGSFYPVSGQSAQLVRVLHEKQLA